MLKNMESTKIEGKCEVFERNKCTGCEGMLYDLDKLKLQCETYQKAMKYEKGEQMTWKHKKS